MKKLFSKITKVITDHPFAYMFILGTIAGEMLGQCDTVLRAKEKIVDNYINEHEEEK